MIIFDLGLSPGCLAAADGAGGVGWCCREGRCTGTARAAHRTGRFGAGACPSHPSANPNSLSCRHMFQESEQLGGRNPRVRTPHSQAFVLTLANHRTPLLLAHTCHSRPRPVRSADHSACTGTRGFPAALSQPSTAAHAPPASPVPGTGLRLSHPSPAWTRPTTVPRLPAYRPSTPSPCGKTHA